MSRRTIKPVPLKAVTVPRFRIARLCAEGTGDFGVGDANGWSANRFKFQYGERTSKRIDDSRIL